MHVAGPLVTSGKGLGRVSLGPWRLTQSIEMSRYRFAEVARVAIAQARKYVFKNDSGRRECGSARILMVISGFLSWGSRRGGHSVSKDVVCVDLYFN